MRCSIVIRAYNEERHIGRLLEGIARQQFSQAKRPPQTGPHAPNPAEWEVILVDSGSTDRTVEIAAEHGARIVHILPQEFSFGRSLNLGITAAQAERIVIASAHVYPVYPDWLERLLAPLDDERVALTYGKQRGDAASKFSETQIFARWFPETSQLRQPHPFCNNANAAIRRSLWQQHPYDETLTGLEDLAWARWAMDQGHAIAYVAEAEIIHVHNETPHGVYNRYRREAMAFKRIYPQERFSFLNLLHLAPSNIFSDLRQAARQKALLRSASSILWFRWMQFWGTYQGYRHPGPVTEHLRRTFYYPYQNIPGSPGTQRDIQPIQYSK